MSISAAVICNTCSNRPQLILRDYVPRMWATLLNNIIRICPYCKTVYDDSLRHLVAGYSTATATEACYSSDIQCINHLCFAPCLVISCL